VERYSSSWEKEAQNINVQINLVKKGKRLFFFGEKKSKTIINGNPKSPVAVAKHDFFAAAMTTKATVCAHAPACKCARALKNRRRRCQ